MEVLNTIADVIASSKYFFDGMAIGGFITVAFMGVLVLIDKKFDVFD